MFILHTEYRPHASAPDFAKGDKETEDGRVLDVVDENGKEYPIETYNNIQTHSRIINPHWVEDENIAQKWMLCVRIT